MKKLLSLLLFFTGSLIICSYENSLSALVESEECSNCFGLNQKDIDLGNYIYKAISPRNVSQSRLYVEIGTLGIHRSFALCDEEAAVKYLRTTMQKGLPSLFQSEGDKSRFGLNQKSIDSGNYIDLQILLYALPKGSLRVTIGGLVRGYTKTFDISEQQEAVEYFRSEMQKRSVKS